MLVSPALAGPLNDTGITWSGQASSGNAATCDPAHPAGQDCHYGRDAQAVAGQLTKVGGSANPANGFDYTKISNSGQALPASATLGSGANDWACTKDNVTGLIWEVKTTSGLRSQDHTYTWYNPASPDGNPGDMGTTSSCGNSLGGQSCNTANYVAAVNAAGLCGATDWRMPTVKELEGIANLGSANPAIDPFYFPNTSSSLFWSGSPFAGSSFSAWVVNFNGGAGNWSFRYSADQVRLVRGGQ